MSKIKCYISHSIRGKYGKSATTEQMIENNQKAIEFYQKLQKKFPTVDFYCPGFHDEFVMVAFTEGYMNEKQILAVDCIIIGRCNCIVNYVPDGYLSDGMMVENIHGQLNGMPVLVMRGCEDYKVFARWLDSLKS